MMGALRRSPVVATKSKRHLRRCARGGKYAERFRVNIAPIMKLRREALNTFYAW